MLTKYSNLKDLIAETERSLVEKRNEVNSKQSLIDNLKVKLLNDKTERDNKVSEQIQEILNSKIAEKKSVIEYDRQVLRQFKSNQLEKIDLIRAKLEDPSNIDSEDYKNSFAYLMKIKEQVEIELGKYLTKEEIEWYKNLGYGRDLVDGDISTICENMVYLYELDNYDQAKISLHKLDAKMGKFEVEAFIVVCVFVFVVMIMYKYYIFLPLFAYLIGCLFTRVKHYYYLLEFVDAYHIINAEADKSMNSYESNVTEALSKSISKLDAVKAYTEQICDSMDREIDGALAKAIKDVRINFDKDKAREEAQKSVEVSDTHLEDVIKEEEENYSNLMDDLISVTEDLRGYREKLKQLKDDINNVYMKLEPSFTEKLILKEFFLGFDSDEEPVTFKYDGKATLILYDGKNKNQLEYVMTTIKMMCGQIMCSMYPLSYSIDVIDCYTSGVSLAPFQVKEDGGEAEGDTPLFKITSTSGKTVGHIKELYEEFNNRRVNILGNFKDIEDYNKQKIEYNARTSQYKVSFFYNFDYSIFKDDEVLHQLCRVSGTVGIIPIVFMDHSQFGEDDREIGIEYAYKPEVILKTIDLFDSNIFGFKISKDSVDIMKYDTIALKNKFRR